jgi:uncharacterized protein with PQ loop repeat
MRISLINIRGGWNIVHSNGLHHISRRKRVHKKFEKYPCPKFWIRLLDRILIIVAIIGPLAMIPQIWNIFILKNAGGIAVVSFLSWAIMDIPWIVYGFVHNERPILVAYILWFVMNLAVAVGALIYG